MAPALQPYHDLRKLLARMVCQRPRPGSSSPAPSWRWPPRCSPALLVPLGRFAAAVAFTGDFVLFAYLLGLGRFFTAAAALDTGSPFEGMGAAREVDVRVPRRAGACFFALLVLARSPARSASTACCAPPSVGVWAARPAPLVLVAAGLFVVLLAENCRIPVDDPNTHLELTMIHEVMVLDHSGPLLGAGPVRRRR